MMRVVSSRSGDGKIEEEEVDLHANGEHKEKESVARCNFVKLSIVVETMKWEEREGT
jgi:hypothetical protein